MKHSRILIHLFFIALVYSVNVHSALGPWEKFRDLKTLSANFEQEKEIAELGVTLKSNGKMHVIRPDFFEWEVVKPKAVSFAFNKGVLEIKQDGKIVKAAESKQLDPKMLSAIAHLKAWLSLDNDFIESHYTVQSIDEKTFEFSPKDDQKMFKKIRLETSKDVPVKEIQLFELSGDLIKIKFSGTQITHEK